MLERLHEELRLIRKEYDLLDQEAREWKKKRDTFHIQLRDLRIETGNLKQRRDELNARVQELKKERDETRELRNQRIQEIKSLQEKLRTLYLKRPKRSTRAIIKEKEEAEWKIQTTSLTLQEEKELGQRVNRLESQLHILNRVNYVKTKITGLQSQIDTMLETADRLHEQLTEFADQSQEIHNRMTEIRTKTSKLQVEADGHHKNYCQKRAELKDVYEKQATIKENIESLRKKLAEEEEKERETRLQQTKKKVRQKAREKLNQGKKLSLAEFKLLAEEDEVP